MLSLVPRSVGKGKARKPRPTEATAPVQALLPLKPETAASSPDQEEESSLDDDWEAIVTLVTCTITSCTVSDDFNLKLRTPQGCRWSTVFSARVCPAYVFRLSDVAVDTLLDQLGSGHRLTPASVAMALSKAVELYNVRLAKVKQAKPTRNSANWGDAAYELGGMQTEGGGYEFQFLAGQQRARRTEEQLAESAVVLVSDISWIAWQG